MRRGLLREAGELFAQAIELPADERDAFLHRVCPGDAELRTEVGVLLDRHHAPGSDSFLEPPEHGDLFSRLEAVALTVHSGTWTEESGRRRAEVLAGRILEGRYRLGGLLGHGTFSSVVLAEDLLSGEEVAVKLLDCLSTEELSLVRREVAILRILRLPGVVQMLDEGIEEGVPFIVMERVVGVPFGGGRPREWPELEPTVLSLLETLSRIHWAGVLHRDLKPENVLVAPDGRPTVLDLGTATESGARTRILNRSHLAGTPLYIAPEQLRGARATVQSDLYAVGVMLYGALAGRPPHRAENLSALIHERLSAPAPSLAEAVPAAPARVVEVVNRLLSLDPNVRPGSAAEAVSLLRGERGGGILFPWLGGMRVLGELRVAAEEGRALDLFGREGAGRTRCLDDLADLLEAQGRNVVRLAPGENPFESLTGFLGGLEDLGERTFDEAQEEIDRQVEGALARGTVILADDPDALDEWTRRGLVRWRSAGCVIRARIGGAAPPGESVLAPLAAQDLEPLIKGSERLFHLRHDAARELFRRTGGLPARVVEEVDGWVRAGLARWESGLLAITRAAVDRLRTGLRVTPPPLTPARDSAPRPGGEIDDVLGLLLLAGSPLSTPAVSATLEFPPWKASALLAELLDRGDVRRATEDEYEALASSSAAGEWSEGRRRELSERLAAAIPSGEEGRLRLLLAAGRVDEVPSEALECARRLLRAGRVGEARVVVLEGLIASRAGDKAEVETALYRTLVDLSLLEGRAASIDEALYWLSRTGEAREDVLLLETVARAALLALRGDGGRALELVGSLPDDPDPTVQRLRCSVSVFAARNAQKVDEETVVADAVARMRRFDDPRCRASASEWMGWLRYGQGRFAEAAELHEEVAQHAHNPPARLSALLNAASAWMEAGDLARAEAFARDALSLAGECRHPLHEARAEWLLRSVTYRAGRDLKPDMELADATRSLGSPNLEGLILLTEAAIAWRTGALALATELAHCAGAVWGRMRQSAGRLLADALAAAAGAAPGPEQARSLVDAARNCPVAGIAAQALGLLARAAPELEDECLAAAREAAAKIPEEAWTARREVISIAEALRPLPEER